MGRRNADWVADEMSVRVPTNCWLGARAQLEAARLDPAGYVAAMKKPAVVDEFQRAGEPLVLAIKAAVDSDTRPGRFILTGSTNFLTVPTISESLAGRVDVIELRPFSQGELHGGGDGFVDRAFAGPAVLLDHAGPALDRESTWNGSVWVVTRARQR